MLDALKGMGLMARVLEDFHNVFCAPLDIFICVCKKGFVHAVLVPCLGFLMCLLSFQNGILTLLQRRIAVAVLNVLDVVKAAPQARLKTT